PADFSILRVKIKCGKLLPFITVIILTITSTFWFYQTRKAQENRPSLTNTWLGRRSPKAKYLPRKKLHRTNTYETAAPFSPHPIDACVRVASGPDDRSSGRR